MRCLLMSTLRPWPLFDLTASVSVSLSYSTCVEPSQAQADVFRLVRAVPLRLVERRRFALGGQFVQDVLIAPYSVGSLKEYAGGCPKAAGQEETGGHMRRMAASEARRDFAEVVNRVAYGKERVIIGRRGKELAAVIPMADLRLLERLAEKLEDRLDAEDALRIEADERDESAPWEQVKEELGLAVPRRGKVKRSTGPRTAAGARPRGNRPRARRAR